MRARRITKSFGDVIALREIDLDVAAGRIHGVVGPKGAGKTTLFGPPLFGPLLTGVAPNPLWQFDGLVDLLASTPKG